MTNLNFRAFQKSTNKMLPVNSLKAICTNAERLTEEEFDDLIIMQSTGLEDKNGKEIFEGDILRLYNEEYNYELFIEVIFNYKSCFWGKKIKNNTDDLWNSDILYNYNLDITEIIGNIYENPELLNS